MINFSFLSGDDERPVSSVPKVVLVCLLSAFMFQTAWHSTRPPLTAYANELPEAPPIEKILLLDLGDSITLAKIIMLWLQAYDNQPGISIPYKQLDYGKLIDWLEQILLLDEKAKYPLFAASRLYSQVPDETKKRQMLEFVYQQFLIDPNRRWPMLAHAVYVAKHRLKDLPLALHYAHALASHVSIQDIPPWIKQMEIYVLEDMGEIESARILIGGLLESGAITDTHELMFLQQRLERLEDETGQNQED